MRRSVRGAIGLSTFLGAAATCFAGVHVDVDRATLDRVVGAAAVHEVNVPLGATGSLRVELRDLKVLALEPASSPGGRDAIRTAVRLVAPDIGLEVPLEPRIALGLVDQDGAKWLELRFDDLPLNVPFMGRVNLARFVKPLRYPAVSVYQLAGAAREVELTSRLTSVRMTREALRLEFEIDVPAAGEERAAAPGP